MFTPTCIFIFQSRVPTSAYPRRYSRHWLLGKSSPDGHPVGTCSGKLRAPSGFPRSCGSFGVSLGVRLSTGFRGGELWSLKDMPDPYPVPFWASLLVRVGLFVITMVHAPVSLPTHRYLLTGVLSRTLSDPCSIPPHRLMTSRYCGDGAFLRSREVGDCTQHRTTSCQGLSLAKLLSLPLIPRLRTPVSRERVAP